MLEPPEGFEDRVGNTFKVIGQSAGNYYIYFITIHKLMTTNPFQIPTIKSGIYLKPGENISQDFLNELSKINDRYTKSGDFLNYQVELASLLKISRPQITDKSVYFLAGFIEGEGSLNVGAKKNNSSNFKVYIDPEFSITQHINGITGLLLALSYFKTGRVRHKSGSNATFVFTIDNRKSLKEKVVPFYKTYISPFGSPVKVRRLKIFEILLNLFEEKAHLDLNKMLYQVLPLWDAMRMQVGQTNQTFKDLEDAQNYVRQADKESKIRE